MTKTRWLDAAAVMDLIGVWMDTIYVCLGIFRVQEAPIIDISGSFDASQGSA